MGEKYEFNCQLQSKAMEFLKKGYFIDVVLHSGSYSFKAHRIILVTHSSWFRDIFLKDINNEGLKANRVVEIDIPENPNGVFEILLNALYDSKIPLTSENAASVLKASLFYNIPLVSDYTREFISSSLWSKPDDSINDSTGGKNQKQTKEECYEELNKQAVLKYASDFCFLKIYDEIELVSEPLSIILIHVYKSKKSRELLDLETVFLSIPVPLIFSMVLRRAIIWSGDNFLSEWDIANIIELYSSDKESLSVEETEALSSFIDFERPDSYKYLLQFDCKWIPPRISRKLLTKIISLRSTTINCLCQECSDAASAVSRWYLLPWLASIDSTEAITTAPVIKIVEFMTTLGESISPINPFDYGFINTSKENTNTGNIISPVRNIFDKSDQYLLAYTDESILPSFTINLGKRARLWTRQVFINSEIYRKSPETHYRHPKVLNITMLSGEGQKQISHQMNESTSSLYFPDGDAKPLNELKISLIKDNPVPILRIKSIEIIGSFLNK